MTRTERPNIVRPMGVDPAPERSRGAAAPVLVTNEEYADIIRAARDLLAHNEELNEAFFVSGKPKEVRAIMMRQKEVMRRLRAALIVWEGCRADND